MKCKYMCLIANITITISEMIIIYFLLLQAQYFVSDAMI